MTNPPVRLNGLVSLSALDRSYIALIKSLGTLGTSSYRAAVLFNTEWTTECRRNPMDVGTALLIISLLLDASRYTNRQLLIILASSVSSKLPPLVQRSHADEALLRAAVGFGY